MNEVTLSILIAGIANLALGILIWRKNPKNKLNKYFGLFAFVSALWVMVNFLLFIFPSLFMLKSAYAFGVLVPASSLFWFFTLWEDKLSFVKKTLFFVPAIIFFIASYRDNLIVKNVSEFYASGFKGETGSIFFWYTGYILFLLAFILIKTSWKLKQSKNERKPQFLYVLTGLVFYIVTVVLVTFVLPLFGITRYTQFDSPSSLIFLAFTAYATTKHNLFNIRILATELFAALIVLIFLINIFVSPSITELIFNLLLFVSAVGFSVQLVRSTIREIDAMHALSEQKSKFMSIASHQLRTPISIIKGYLSLLRDGSYGKLESEQLETLNKIYKVNENMNSAVEDFLNISRAERGTLKYNFEKTNINDIIETVVHDMKMTARTKGLELKWQKSKQAILVDIDREKITQVINNLIDNAIKYTEQGGVSIRVAEGNEAEGVIRIYIIDTGIGLDGDEKHTMFESFKRGVRGEKINAAGTGLGLYVVKLIVEDHGGKIWAESSGKDQGSTFVIELPVRRREEASV